MLQHRVAGDCNNRPGKGHKQTNLKKNIALTMEKPNCIRQFANSHNYH